MKHIFLFISLALFVLSCSQTPPPKPLEPVPSERQLAWHDLEFYAFVHFNMNTFSNMEWGFGDESPELFNPTNLDCRQWVRVCKDAGMKGIIITAKHHDGFCLWPSEYTEHSVKNSPWKNGNGDVVRELSEACKEYGLKMGIYLSPWDRNHSDYGKPEYITYFRNQLRELLTNYGDIYEVWFDGANGGTGWYGGANENRKIDNKTYYDWENTRKIVRELQPDACMFSDAGPDVRWVGNEQGWAGETNWSTLNRNDFAPGVVSDLKFLQQGQEDGSHWLPAEVDVSIRPGWYYHPYEDHKVKSVPQLLDIYYNSIGRNASFLLNFPVDSRGLIHEKDVDQLMKFTEVIKADFAVDISENKAIKAAEFRGNSRKYSAKNVLDDNPETYWSTDDDQLTGSLTIDFEKPTEFNRFLVQEYIKLGQRVKAFSVEVYSENNWKKIASETTIGYKRILRFPNIVASKIRFNIIESKACPVIAEIGIYKAPKVLSEPEIMRNKDGLVTINSFDNGLDIYYTLDGNYPGENSIRYSNSFMLSNKAVLKAIAIDEVTGLSSPVSTQIFDVARSKWKLVSSENQGHEAVFDGNPMTEYKTRKKTPVDFIIDLGEELNLEGFIYLPGQSRWDPGIIFNYEFYVSSNGKSWGKPVVKGEFSNIVNSPVLQEVRFDEVKAKFVKLRALSPAFENGLVGIAEFNVVTK